MHSAFEVLVTLCMYIHQQDDECVLPRVLAISWRSSSWITFLKLRSSVVRSRAWCRVVQFLIYNICRFWRLWKNQGAQGQLFSLCQIPLLMVFVDNSDLQPTLIRNTIVHVSWSWEPKVLEIVAESSGSFKIWVGVLLDGFCSWVHSKRGISICWTKYYLRKWESVPGCRPWCESPRVKARLFLHAIMHVDQQHVAYICISAF